MKKITAAALCGAVMALLCACSPAATEPAATKTKSVTPTPDAASATAPTVTATASADTETGGSLESCEALSSLKTDLDGDGTKERVEFIKKAEGVTVRVSRGETAWEYALPREAENAVSQYVLKKGKRSCVLFCYDLASDDYQTAVISLGKELEVNILDGIAESFDNGVLNLNLTVNVAGTWLGTASYAPDNDMHFERAGKLYGINANRELTVKKTLSALDADGGKFTLDAGTKLRLISSDLESVLYFSIESRDSVCSFTIAPQDDSGEFLIDGVPEREAFDGLEYYD